MTVQPHQPADVALPTPAPTITGSDMSAALAVLRQFDEVQRLAAQAIGPLVYTDAVPLHHWPMPPGETLRTFPNPRLKHPREDEDQYRRRQEIAVFSATGTAMRGISVGLTPYVALEQMHSVRGKVGMSTKVKYALALSRGVKAWDVKLTDTEVTCAGIHPLTGDTIEITITMEDARRAKWTDNDAYIRTPKDMLWSRAMGRVLDRVAGHILFGLPSVDELRDATDDVDEPAPTPVTSRVTVADLPPAPPTPAPAITPAPAAKPEPEPDQSAEPEPPVEKLRRELGDTFNRLKVSGPGVRARRARICSDIVGRPIATSLDLTAEEIQSVLDNLTADVVRRIETPTAEPAAEPAPVEQAPAHPWATQPEYDPTADPTDPWGTPALDVPGDQQ